MSDSNSTEVTTPQKLVEAIKFMLHAQQEDQRVHEETHKTMMASCKEEDEFLKIQASFAQAIEFIDDFISYVENSFTGKLSAYSFNQVTLIILKHSTKLDRMSHTVPVLAQIAYIDLSSHKK